MNAETAQETFRHMLREEIAPGLRALGFKGSGQNYELPSETHWLLLGFQKGPDSDATAVEFTINLHVVDRVGWEAARAESAWMPRRPTATTQLYGDFAWWERLTALVPPVDAGEIWWTIGAGGDTRQLSDAVLWAVREYGLPELLERSGRGPRSASGPRSPSSSWRPD